MIRTTFFTAANRAYEPFVLPYVASVLLHNDDALVEIVLERPRQFEMENCDALEVLGDAYPARFRFRRGIQTARRVSWLRIAAALTWSPVKLLRRIHSVRPLSA